MNMAYNEPRWWVAGTLNDEGLLISIQVVYRDYPYGLVGSCREKKTQTVILSNWDLAESSEERQWTRVFYGDYGPRVVNLGHQMAREEGSTAAKMLRALKKSSI